MFLRDDDRFDGETLFVLGGKSRYFVPERDERRVRNHFSRVRFETIAESGHNPHFDARPRFAEMVRIFLTGP